MAIRPVSSVSFRNNYKISFESKKHKNNKDYVTNSVSHKLAIPAAALILSMMPLNSTAESNEIFNEPIIENISQSGKGKVVARADFTNGMSNGATVAIEFISTDNDDNSVEKVSVTFSDYITLKVNGKSGKRTMSTTVNVDTLKIENVKEVFSDGSERKFKRYYVIGSGSDYISRVLGDNGEILDSSSKFIKKQNEKLSISDELYEYLKNLLGNQVNYKTTSVVEKGIPDEEYLY